MSKVNTCGVITGCTVMMFSIAGVVLLSLLLKSKGKENTIISSLEKNLESRGILAIQRVNSPGCPSGTLPLFNNIFPGTHKKCLCQNSSNGMYSFQNENKNRCNVNTYMYRCQLVTLPRKNLEIYRGARLCYKPSQFSYDSYAFSTSKNGCPSNMRVCGKDQKGYLCLNSTYACPVNYIKMFQGNAQNIQNVPGGQIINLNNNVHLVYSNQNYEGQIVAETSWGFQGMCITPEQRLIADDSNYQLFTDSGNWVEDCDSMDGVSKDERWKLLDTYNWLYLLGENASTFKKLEPSNNLDPADLSIPYQVYQRGYIHFNKDCRWDKNVSTHGNLRKINQETQDYPVSITGMLIGALVMFSIAIAASCCLACISLGSGEDKGPIGCCMCVCVLLLVAACLVGATFYYTRDLVKINEESKSFNEKCMDKTTVTQLSYMESNKSNMMYYTLIALILAVLGMLLLCCFLCCSRSSKSSGGSRGGHYEDKPHGYSNSYNYGKGGKIKHGHSFSSHSSNDEPQNNYQGAYYDNPGFNQNPGFFNGQTRDEHNAQPNQNNFFNGGQQPNFNNNNDQFNNFDNNNQFNDFNNNNNNPQFNDFNNNPNPPDFNNNNNQFNDFNNNNNNFGNNDNFNNPPPPSNDYGLFGPTGGNDNPGGFNDFGNNQGGGGGNDGFFDGGGRN